MSKRIGVDLSEGLGVYDGILVLTSNRVRTFDEAFKSRIQLALYYPKLDHVKRAKVWENFIERLIDLNEENIDFSDLRDNFEELAKNKKNGREIRMLSHLLDNIHSGKRQSSISPSCRILLRSLGSLMFTCPS